MKKVTIKDLARMANVSAATVSMVLNGKNSISQPTRDKILALAREYNYVPNVSARSLVSSRTDTIGILIPDLAEPFNAYTLRAISRKVSATPYKLILYDAHENPDSKHNVFRLINHEGRVDGLVHKAIDISPEDRQLMEALRIPVVIFENDLDWVDCVSVDNFKGTYEATRFLIARGYEEIGVISCKCAPGLTRLREDGVRQALLDAGLSFSPNFVYRTEAFKASEGEKAAEYFHALPKKPSAIFSIAGDYMACGFLAQIKRLGYRIPEDFALIGFDDLEYTTFVEPRLTTVRQPLSRMAGAAIDLLIARIQNRNRPFESVKFDTELVIRESV